jgi:hypothetical protein
MDGALCQQFFCQPTQPVHRRYEALRAVFVDHRPLKDVAQQYGYCYGTFRNLVSKFGAQCAAGKVSPFFRRPDPDDRTGPVRVENQQSQSCPTSLNAVD